MKEITRVMVEKLFSIVAAQYLKGDTDHSKTFRYDNLGGILGVRVRKGLGGPWDTDNEATKKNVLALVEAGYLEPLTDLKGDLIAPGKRYKILRFEEDCAKVCTTAPKFEVGVDHSYYNDTDDLTYHRYSDILEFEFQGGEYLGYVWAHQDEYIIAKLVGGTVYFPKALLPTQAKIVSLIYMEILKDKITSGRETKHPATLNLFADIHEVLASALRAIARGELTHGYLAERLLPIIFRSAPLLIQSPINRVQDAAKWLLQHPECADWEYVKDVWPEPTEEED